MGFDILSNVASDIIIEETASDTCVNEVLLSTLTASISSDDRFQVKFGFSEKATKFEKNLLFTFDKSVVFCARNSVLVRSRRGSRLRRLKNEMDVD